MVRTGIAILAAGLCVGGCASEPVLTPGQLNANPGLYDGKQVKVRAWLVYKFENIGLWDSQSAYENAGEQRDPAACVSYEGPDMGLNSPSRMVTLTGIFQKDIFYDPDPNVVIVGNGWCNKTGLVIGR